jgi:glucitol/sorbitol PTS system EIIB component
MAIFGRSKKKEEAEADVNSTVVPPPAQGEGRPDAKAEPSTDSVIDTTPAGTYRKVLVKPGNRGWGKGLVIAPKPGRDLIYSVTGGGIHPVAQRIADLTGGRTFDGFKSKAKFEEIACAVIDCGGTARIGVYPMKGVLTVDVHGASPSGPLMRFINEENFVSGISVTDIEVVE